MRIRIFQAFASNNSGSYTLVGTFQSVKIAAEVAEVLRAVAAEQDVWASRVRGEESNDAESPLEAFARMHGLSDKQPGRFDDWPEYGEPARVTAVGCQVLIHADYTLTMPRVFGEFFYKREGRVDLELDHAHHDLVTTIQFYVPQAGWKNPDAARRMAVVESALLPLLPALTARAEHDTRPVVAPLFDGPDGGTRRLSAVFKDLVEGVEMVRNVAARHGVHLHVRVRESEVEGTQDPLAHLRPRVRPWGTSHVILWSTGSDKIRALKAVREVMGTELREAKDALDDLPRELLVDVDQAYAENAVRVLQDAGCDAEVVMRKRAD